MKTPKLRYILRAPVFPVIFMGPANAVCASTPKQLESYLLQNLPEMEEQCALIDYRWEGWAFYPKESLISPLVAKKRYTKREFLLFCGVTEEQLAQTNLNQYSREEIFDCVINEAHPK